MCLHNTDEIYEKALDQAVELGTLLEKAADICLGMDTPDSKGDVLGSKVCYTEKMALQAVLILNSILSNRAIHHKVFESENQAYIAGNKLYEALKDIFDFNTREVTYRVLDLEMPDPKQT